MKKLMKIFKYLCLAAYIICIVVLMVESGMNGKTSANQSNTLGGTIANIFNEINGDQTIAVAPTSISINNKISTAFVGEKYKLTINTLPEDATYKEVSFTSNNPKVATVDNSGTISFLNEGTVKIDVKNTVYPNLTDSVTIEVSNVVATSINSSINSNYNENGYYTLFIGHTYAINTIFEPANTTNKDLSYSLDKNTYIEINDKGEITPIKYSSRELTEITIAHEGLINTLKVNVDYENIVSLSTISVDDFDMYVTETKSMKVNYEPTNATFKDFTLTSSDSSVASISGTKVVGKKAGTAIIEITSKTYTNIKTTCNVNVIAQPKMTSYSASISEKLTNGSSKNISITNVTPKYANISNKSFESSDPSIASVDMNGKVTSKSIGKCSITVKIDDIIKILDIEVVEKLDSVTKDFTIKTNDIYGDNLHLFVDKDYIINSSDENALFSISNWDPLEPTLNDFTYELSDSSFGTIAKNTIKFNKPGTVDLIITHAASGIVKFLTIEIIYDFSIIDLNNEKIDLLTLNVNDYAYFSIDDHQNSEEIHQTYEVTFNNNDIAAVDFKNGTYNLLGLSEGETIVNIVPFIDNVEYGFYKKEISLKSKHVLSNGISLFLSNSDSLLEIKDDSITMNLLDKYSLEVRHKNNPTTSKIQYDSLDESILKIEEDGTLNPLKAGKTKIVVTEEKSAISKEISVCINNVILLDEKNSFTINGMNLTYDKSTEIYSITNGFSASFNLNFDSKSTYTIVKYSSSDETIATIGEDGTITPYKAGVTEISASVNDEMLEPIEFKIKLEVKRQDFIKDLNSFFKFIRKGLGHYGAFLVLGIFSTLTWLLFFNKKMFFSVPVNFFSGFSVAALTEFIQSIVPGRGPSFKDVLLDFYGFLTSSIVITLVLIGIEIIVFIRKKINNKK